MFLATDWRHFLHAVNNLRNAILLHSFPLYRPSIHPPPPPPCCPIASIPASPYCLYTRINVALCAFCAKVSEITEITRPSNKVYSSGTTFKRKVVTEKVRRESTKCFCSSQKNLILYFLILHINYLYPKTSLSFKPSL